MAKSVRHVHELSFPSHCGPRYTHCFAIIISNVVCFKHFFPKSQIKADLIRLHADLKIGDVQDFTSFTSAVIDDKAFARISSYIDHAKASKHTEIIAGGQYDDSKGYFIQPTIIVTTDPLDKLMTEEIFGPVVTIYVYKDKDLKKTMDLVGDSTAFALTGAVFAQDQ